MSIQNVLDMSVGRVGDIAKVGKHKYQKAKNGKWALVITPKLRSSIIKSYRNSTLRAVAEEFKLGHSTVQRIVDEAGVGSDKGVLIEKHKQIVAKNESKIAKWYLAGISKKEIKQRLGISLKSSSVSDFISRAGIKLPQSLRIKQSVSLGRHSSCQRRPEAISELLSIDLSGLSFYRYKRLVRRLSHFSYVDFKHILDPSDQRSFDFHIDHQLSIFNGYYVWNKSLASYVPRKCPVPLTVIGHPANLKLLTSRANCQKQNQDHHSVDALLEKIKTFENKHGEPFSKNLRRTKYH